MHSTHTSTQLPRLATVLRHLALREVSSSLATQRLPLAEIQLHHPLLPAVSQYRPARATHPALAPAAVLARLVVVLGLGLALAQAVPPVEQVSPALYLSKALRARRPPNLVFSVELLQPLCLLWSESDGNINGRWGCKDRWDTRRIEILYGD